VFILYNVFVAHWKVEPLHATALVSFYSALAVIPVYLAMRANSGALERFHLNPDHTQRL
jgi:hypothetical protein